MDPPKFKGTKIKHDFPFDEGMRVERPERIVRPKPNVDLGHDPADDSDNGPHVDRVGMPTPDE